MPYKIEKESDLCPASKSWAVIKEDDGKLMGCHETKKKAQAQISAIQMRGKKTMSAIEEIFDKIRAVFEPFLGRVMRPYPNEHACRIRDPDDFQEDSFRRIEAGEEEGEGPRDGKKLSIIIGKLKGETKTTTQAYRYPIDTWTEAQAREHCKEEGGTFEAAKKEDSAERAVSSLSIREQVWEALNADGGWVWLQDIYYDDGDVFAIIADGGKLYRIALTVDDGGVAIGERVQVTEAFPPVAQRGIVVYRQADGRHRWFAVAATAVLNRVGEIDSKALFDSFVTHAEETSEYPYLTFYHLGEKFRMGQADLLLRDGVAYIASGLWDEDSALADVFRAAVQREPDYWGASIGYDPTTGAMMVEVAKDVKVPVYLTGINDEISILPEPDAANLFTAVSTKWRSIGMLDKVKEALKRAFDNDEEAAAPFIAMVDEVNRSVEEGNLITRNQSDDGDETPQSDETPQPVERDVELDEGALAAIAAKVAEGDAFKTLAGAVEALTAEVTELKARTATVQKLATDGLTAADERLALLERDEDEKQREWQEDLPQRETLRVTYRPRQALAGGNGESNDVAANVRETALQKVK